MSKTFKIVLVLLVVASVASAALAVLSFIGKEREYMKRLLVEDKLAATLKDKTRLEKDLDLNKKAKEESEKKIVKIGADIKQLSSQLDEAKDKQKSVSLDLVDKKREIAKLNENLEKEKKEKLSISRKLEDLEYAYEKSKIDISKLRSKNTNLEKTVADLKEKSVSLDKIVVSPLAGEAPPAPEPGKPSEERLKGRTLVVNRDYNFIVTDLGQEDGIKKGMIFEIRDGTMFLGKAEIDKVYDTMSSATILAGANINNIKKGNLIIESR